MSEMGPPGWRRWDLHDVGDGASRMSEMGPAGCQRWGLQDVRDGITAGCQRWGLKDVRDGITAGCQRWDMQGVGFAKVHQDVRDGTCSMSEMGGFTRMSSET